MRIRVTKQCNSASTLFSCSWIPTTPPIDDLGAEETATVSFYRIPENDAQEDFISVTTMNGSTERLKNITLVPGTYDISVNLLENKKTIVPSEQICYDTEPLNPFGGKECQTINETDFDSFTKGGLELNSYTINSEDLKDKSQIILYIFETPSGYTIDANGITNLKHDDLDAMDAEKYSTTYSSLVIPKFK